MGNIKVYFSDFFEIDEDIIEEYGAINISLINDLPLFIDFCYLIVKIGIFKRYTKK